MGNPAATIAAEALFGGGALALLAAAVRTELREARARRLSLANRPTQRERMAAQRDSLGQWLEQAPAEWEHCPCARCQPQERAR